MDIISQLSSTRSSSRLTKENIKWLEKRFRQHAGDRKEIRKEDFNKIIQTKNQFFTDRFFDIFDKDRSGAISLHEFLDALHQFAGKEPDDKIHFLFEVYDVDKDGFIQCEEMEKVMRACMEENKVKFSDDQIHALTMVLFEDSDEEKRGSPRALTYEGLKTQLEKYNGLLENLSISIEGLLVPPKPERLNWQSTMSGLIPHQFSLPYIRNNYGYLAWLLIFLSINIGLFVSTKHDPSATVYFALAGRVGACLDFNCVFILILMLRECFTFLRQKGPNVFLSIEQHIFFHKITGCLIFLFSYFHSAMHLIDIEHKISREHCLVFENCSTNSQNMTYLKFLFDPTATMSFGLISGYAYYTGIVLIVTLTTMAIGSLPFIRRHGCFEVFYWTHLLYFSFWALLIIHAPNFWRWFVVPGVIFLIEKLFRYYSYRFEMGTYKTSVITAILLPSKVTHLIIRRPVNFEFNSGDYVYIRIPRIAKHEWHPMEISSAPEQADELSLHIRSVGEWTTRLNKHYETEQERLNCVVTTRPDSAEGVKETSQELLQLELHLEGPYDGGLSRRIFRAEHAVLITTGIGVTPFSSVLQSIMHRYWESRICCPNCNSTWCDDMSQLNLKKVDFFWISREQTSFEWFVHLLSQLEIEQAEIGVGSGPGTMERFLDIHMYNTSATQKTDMKVVGLKMAIDLMHGKEKRDHIARLKDLVNFGRPDWDAVFTQLASEQKGQVTVFFCGAPSIAKSLKAKCDEFEFLFRNEMI